MALLRFETVLNDDLGGNLVIEPVEVMRGRHGEATLFGPLPGVRQDQVIAYEFELPPCYAPWPGRTLLERTFVLLDLGVSFANPCWASYTLEGGTFVDRAAQGPDLWYVDLISVEQEENRFVFRDLYIDVMVPMDGRHYRMLDLDEFADAMDGAGLQLAEAADALRRWQGFLDRHLHATREPIRMWTDFPPAAIQPLANLPPFGNAVQAGVPKRRPTTGQG